MSRKPVNNEGQTQGSTDPNTKERTKVSTTQHGTTEDGLSTQNETSKEPRGISASK